MNGNQLENLLRVFIKLLYDDISYYIIDYILKNEKAEEQKLANDLNLSYSQIRLSLNNMEKHGIVVP
jgi:predicted transcriptional regulator